MNGMAETTADVVIRAEAHFDKAIAELQKAKKEIHEAGQSMGGSSGITANSKKTENALTSLGNRATETGKKIKKAMKTDAALAFAAAGAAALNFAKQCTMAAVESEAAWARFGANARDSGVDWNNEQNKIKDWASTYSANMGYTVGDTRDAMNTMMNYGMSFQFAKDHMESISAVAAKSGRTEAEAAEMVVQAMAGRGTQLKKLTGLEIKNYKAKDGSIDRERLMQDLYKDGASALQAYQGTTQAAVNKMEGQWMRLKVQLGTAMIPILNVLGNVIGKIADWFDSLKPHEQQFIAAIIVIGGIVGVIIGAVGLLGTALIGIGAIFSFVGISAAAAFWPILIVILAVLLAVKIWLMYGDQIQAAWGNAMNYLTTAFNNVKAAILGFVNDVQTQFGRLMDWFGTLFTNPQEAIKQAFQTIEDLFRGELGVIGDIIMANPFIRIWVTIITMLVELFRQITGIYSPGIMAQLMGEEMGHIGEAIWNGITGIVGAITGLAMAIVNGFINLVTGIYTYFVNLYTRLRTYVQQMLTTVVSTFMQIRQRIISTVQSIPQRVALYFTLMVQYVRTRLNLARQIVTQLWNNIRTTIVNRVQNIVNRVSSFFGRIPGIIRQKLTDAVNSARDKAQEIFDNIINKIKEIPEKIGEELGKIPEKIQKALGDAAAAASSGAAGIASAFLSGLRIASPGIIQRSTASEFGSLPGIILEQGLLAARNSGDAALGIAREWDRNMPKELSSPSIALPEMRGLSMNIQDYSRLPQVQLGLDNQTIQRSLQLQSNGVMPGYNTSNIDNRRSVETVNNLHVDTMKFDCTDLTEAQTRQLAYKILQVFK